MSQLRLPADPATGGLLSLTDSLGIDVNSLVTASQTAGQPQSLTHLNNAEKAITQLREYTIISLRRQDKTWSQIAHYLGTTPQNAHKKYRHLDVPQH